MNAKAFTPKQTKRAADVASRTMNLAMLIMSELGQADECEAIAFIIGDLLARQERIGFEKARDQFHGPSDKADKRERDASVEDACDLYRDWYRQLHGVDPEE